VILLDTHVLAMLILRPERLSRVAARAIQKAEAKAALAIASITLLELALLVAADRIRLESPAEAFLNQINNQPSLRVLEITAEIAVLATQFPPSFPKDPADRLIGATARARGIPLVTQDQRLQDSPLLRTVW
jgi:PIN domain nuclease of toxin-antitoxin system